MMRNITREQKLISLHKLKNALNSNLYGNDTFEVLKKIIDTEYDDANGRLRSARDLIGDIRGSDSDVKIKKARNSRMILKIL